MKKFIVLTVVLCATLYAKSQDTFRVKIAEPVYNFDPDHLICGDTVDLIAEVLLPASLQIDLFTGEDDIFNYEIVNKLNNKVVYAFDGTIPSSYQTTLYLSEGDYIFKWLYGCAACNNPQLEGQTSEWIVVGDHVECAFSVTGNININTLQYTWVPYTENSYENRIFVSPKESGYYKVIATSPTNYSATDSIYLDVSSFSLDYGDDIDLVCGLKMKMNRPRIDYYFFDDLSYKWEPSTGLDDPNIQRPTVEILQDQTYIVTASTSKGCITKDTIKANFTPLKATSYATDVYCGEKAQLSVSTNGSPFATDVTYKWTPDSLLDDNSIQNPFAEITETTTFSVVVSNSKGCKDSTTQTVYLVANEDYQPEICMVTVDSANHNVIVKKQDLSFTGDTVYIYKETTKKDEFIKIGALADQETYFTDTLSNSLQNSNRYKISGSDACGFETGLSLSHKTIHLTINKGIRDTWNLIWSGYEGLEFDTYQIYRGFSPDGMQKIAEIASNYFTFTDLYPPAGEMYYQIRIDNISSCAVETKSASFSSGSIQSNLVDTKIFTAKDITTRFPFRVFPNPAHDKIQISSDTQDQSYNVCIVSLDGKILKKRTIDSNGQINLSEFNTGVYILKAENKYGTYYKTLVIE
ncbi:T9SS type A sorting domain-containing protein [Saccharicrinis sp. FJH54]|uniref:T9SS type A sorting domain-containing protein n=1 Tax=Saccharicrinis sp. FJH54 TaxID=3344665 RepID=UPI0035D528C3